MIEKRCPVLRSTSGEDIQKCFRETCAWWDAHYNCCAVLSSAILMEILAKSKDKRLQIRKREDLYFPSGDDLEHQNKRNF